MCLQNISVVGFVATLSKKKDSDANDDDEKDDSKSEEHVKGVVVR